MIFCYTSASNKEQLNPGLSLGGYLSSPVPNSRVNNLFGDITSLGIDRNEPVYIGLFLKNTTGTAITGVSLWFDYPTNCYSKLEIAAVMPLLDPEGNPIIEIINSIFSAPYNGVFFEATGQSNAISLGDIAKDGLLGIWFKRTILKDIILADYAGQVTKPLGQDMYIESVLGTQDEIDINLSWT